MKVYLDLVVLLNFLVDLLLLLGTNRLAGHPGAPGRCALAAALGGIYGGACMLPGFRFLGNLLWRSVCLGLMGCIAFGWSVSALRRSVLFVLLSMALGGVASAMGAGGFGAIVLAAGAVSGMCLLGFRGRAGSREYTQVRLRFQGREQNILALRDTGNTLTDPVSGQSVLVVSGQVGCRLLGLTMDQIAAPVETVASGTLPGLRLIPYRAVGQSAGMLLAIRLEEVRIGKWQGSTLVAFAPQGLDREETYQALTGGMA